MLRSTWAIAALLWAMACGSAAADDDAELRAAAQEALRRAVTFYREQVASHGGYVYYYREDLSQQWGEGETARDTIFVQPPATPTVGLAYLAALRATGDEVHRAAVRETAGALVDGQLQSGGWDQAIYFSPAKRMGKYRQRRGGDWNSSSLDDGQTQAALAFLMQADEALQFKGERIHEATTFGLRALVAAQFANGAFPQSWTRSAASQPVVAAKLPDYDWKTERRVKNYWDYYTLNDGLAGTVSETLILAHQIYGREELLRALQRLGDFLILAQMPEPQPAWCQQYSYEMYPSWARKFEPPAIAGSESQDVMRTLIRIAEYTGDKKYLKPLDAALKYFDRCQKFDGKVARFYELGTNRPLFMDEKYELTYDDSSAPNHYGWKQPAHFDKIARELSRVRHGEAVAVARRHTSTEQARQLIAEIDGQHRWVSVYRGEGLVGQPKFAHGFRYLSSEVFARNVTALADFLAAPR